MRTFKGLNEKTRRLFTWTTANGLQTVGYIPVLCLALKFEYLQKAGEL